MIATVPSSWTSENEWDLQATLQATHDVVLAENLPAESYLDTANRSVFTNAGNDVVLHPDFSGGGRVPILWEAKACAPLLCGGERLHALRAWIGDRSAEPGGATVKPTGRGSSFGVR